MNETYFYFQQIIKENSGRIIRGVKQDKQDLLTYYTESYLNRHKSVIKGALAAITKPTQISTVISHCGIKENIFFCKLNQFFFLKII